MNSGILDEVFLSPVAAHSASQNIADTQTAFKVLIALAMITAINAGTFTSSTTTVGKLSRDVQYVLALLNQAGYQAHIVANTLVVSW